MKKSQNLSRKTWKLLAKNLIILAVLGVVAFVGVMSWFTKSTTATADGISVKTEVTDGLEYYITKPSDTDQYDTLITKGVKWHDKAVTIDTTVSEFKFLENLFLCEVTGDGKTFNIPKLLQYGEFAYVDTSSDFSDAAVNENYMSFDIYFRTKGEHTVTLKSASSIAPAGEINADTEEGMKNAAIGAVRMSVLNGDSCELLWIPGPNVWYAGLANKGEGELQIQTGSGFGQGSVYIKKNSDNTEEPAYTGELTSSHAYYNSSKTRKVIKPSDENSKLVASTKGDYKLGLANDLPIVSLSTKKGDYYYNHARINLWIEGEDAEARLKCVGGKFNMDLKFGITN